MESQGQGGDVIVEDIEIRARDMASAVLQGFGGALDTARTKASGVTSEIGALAHTFSLFGLAMGAGAVAVLGFSAHAAMGFASALNHVQAFAGASAADIKTWSAQILQMAPTLGLSATGMANSMYALASAGVRGKDVMIAVTAAAKAAAASQTDMATVTDALTTAMNAYHLHGQAVVTAQNEMTVAVLRGKMEFRDFAASLGQVVPVASQAHVGLSMLGSMMAVLTNQGNSAAESSLMLKNVIMNLLAPTRRQEQVASALGIAHGDLAIKNGNLMGTFQRIKEAISGTMPSWREIQQATGVSETRARTMAEGMFTANQAIRQLFGGNTIAMRAFFALMSDGGAQVKGILGDMQHSSKIAADAIKTAFQGPQHQMDVFHAILEKLAIVIGTPLVAAINNLLMAANPWFNRFAELAAAHPKLTMAILGTAMAIGVISVAARGLTLLFTPYLSIFQRLGQGFIGLRTYAYEAGAATDAYTASARASGGAMDQLIVQNGILDTAWRKQAASMLTTEELMGAMDAELGVNAAAQREAAVATDVGTVSIRSQIVAFGEWESRMLTAAATSIKTALSDAATWVSTRLEILAAMAAEEGGYVALGSAALVAGAESVGSAVKSAAAWVLSSARTVGALVAEGAAWLVLNARIVASNAIQLIAVGVQETLTVVQEQGALKALAMGVAWVAMTVATGAWSVAAGIATAAAFALDLALDANPISLLVITIGLLVVGLVLLVTHLGFVWDAVQRLGSALGDKLVGLFNMAKAAASALGDMLGFLGTKIGDLLSWLGKLISNLPGVTGALNLLGGAAKAAGNFFDWATGPIQHLGSSIDSFGRKHKAAHVEMHASTMQAISDIKSQGDLTVLHHLRMQDIIGKTAVKYHAMTLSMIQDAKAAQAAQQGFAISNQAVAFNAGGGGAAESALTAAITALPANLRDAMTPVLAQFKSGLESASTTYQGAVHRENESYASKLHAIQQHFVEAYTSASNVAREKMVKTEATNIVSLRDAHAQHIQGLQQTFAAATERIRQAMASMASPSGLWTALQKQVDDVAKNRLAALSLAILKGSGHLDHLSASAARAVGNQDKLSASSTTATNMVNARLGRFGEVISATQKVLQDKLSNALAKVQLDLLHHSSSLAADERTLRAAQGQMDRFTKAQKAAEASASGVKASFDSMKTAIDNRLKSATDSLAMAFLTGRGNVEQLSVAAGKAQVAALRLADASSRAATIALERAGQWGAAMQNVSTTLTTRLNNAIGLVADKLMHHQKVTEADRQSIERAQRALDIYTGKMNQAKTFAGPGPDATFSQAQQAVQTRIQTAMDALANAFRTGKGHIDQLTQRVIAASAGTDRFRWASEQAALAVAKRTGDFSGLFDAMKARVDATVTKTMASLDGALLTHHGNLTKLTAQVVRAQGAQQHLTDVQTAALVRIANAGGSASAALSAVASNVKGKLDEAIARVTLDILKHGEASQKDIAALNRHATEQIRLDAATAQAAQQSEAALARAAIKAGDFADAATHIKTLVDTQVTRAADALAGAIYSGVKSLGSYRTTLDAATVAQAKWNVASQKAADMVTASEIRAARAAGDLATAFDKAKSLASTQLSQAMSGLAEKFRLHQQVTQNDIMAVVAAQRADQSYAAALVQANLAVARASHDYAAIMSAAQAQATQSANAYAGALLEVSQGASMSADSLALLRQGAVNDAMQLQSMQMASRQVTDAINQEIIARHSEYDATLAAANAHAAEAKAAYETALMNHVTGQSLDVLRQAAISAAAAAYGLAQIDTEAAKDIKSAVDQMFGVDDTSGDLTPYQDATLAQRDQQQQFTDSLAEQRLADQQKQQAFQDSLAQQRLATQQQTAATKANTSATSSNTTAQQAANALMQAALAASQQQLAMMSRLVFLSRLNLGRVNVAGSDFVTWMNGLGAEGAGTTGVMG